MRQFLAVAASIVVLTLLAGTALLHPMPVPQAQITVTLNPTLYGLAISQSLTLFATVANDSSNKGVTWSVSGANCSGNACGVLSQTTSTSTLYTAPATGGTYVLTATSVANSTAFASAQIAVTDLGGVYTYRHNLTSAGVNSKEYLLTPSNVNSTSFGKLFSCTVDESVYASPLWVANVSIAGGVHNIVIVATQNDSVYAFDADGSNGTTCIQYWHASLLGTNYGAASGATPIPPVDTGETGDIPTNIGITSTPVIDLSTNILYVESNTKENGNYFQRLHALHLGTGAENTSWPINITASVSGTGDGSSGGKLPFIPVHENQRPALALVNGSVYMEFGSHGDNSPWHGWVIGYNTSTRALSGAFATTPNSTGGGIWMAGSAPAVDSSNNLYVITSNGTYNGSTEFGDSFLKLSTSSGVALAGSTTAATFTPDDQGSLSSGNIDLGQGGAITLLDSVSSPNPHLLIGGGKEGVLYLLNRDNMGGYNANNNNGALQTWSLGSGGSNYTGIAAAGGFWQNTFYIAGSDGSMQAYAFNTTTGLFSTNPTSQSTNTFPFPGATPEISASGTTNAILWALDTSGNGTNGQSTGPAVLYAYEATNLNTQLWNSAQNTPQGGSNQAANAVKFVIPTVANGKVYVVGVNSLTVYGLFSSYKTAAAPTFTPAPGTYVAPITLSDASSGATIYYTTDGSLPTTSSNVYSGPITIAATTTITAMATAPGLGSSPPVSGTYTVGPSTVTYVQGAYATPQSSQTSVPVVFTGKQTLGDLNVVVVGWNDTTAAVSSVNDRSGNAYTLAVGPTAISGTLSQSIYYAKNIASAAAGTNTVAVTFTKAAAYPDIRILEYSGVDPNTPVDVTAANTGNSATSSSGSATTTNATDLIFGANIVTSVTSGPGSGFTSRLLTSPDGDIAEDEMVTSTGSYSATASLSSGQWIMQLVAFRAAGSGSGGTLPIVSSVSPNSGPASGGTAVTINGTNFAAGATVTFGSASATNVVVTNSTTITATTPAGSSGAVTVTVTVNGQSGSLTNGFAYVVPPTVSSVSPNSGSTSGGTAVTITGTNFVSGATVTFGGAAATSVVVTNSTTITATTPSGSAGAVTVTVTNAGSQSGSLANGFTYVVLPTVSSVSPNSGPGAGGTAVTITGTNFASGATVKVGSAAATNVAVTNSTTITATTPAGTAGSVTVTVTVNGQSGSLTNGFTYVVAPTVSSVSPNTGPTSGGTAVTIAGTNFAAGATVTFGSAAATSVVVTNSTTITAKTPAGSVGAVTVTVTNTGSQSGSLTNGFTYVTVTTISYVQGNYATPQTSQTSVPVKFNSAQTLGDLNVVVVGWNDTTAAVSSVADSSGNTYALAAGPNAISGTLSQSIYYAKNIASAGAGANTVTVTFTKAAAYPDIRILEYSGADPNTPVDVTAANTGNSTTSSSGSVTTTNATDLIFGANIVTSGTSGPGTGFIRRLLTSPDGDIAEDEMVSSTGSYSATAPLSSGQWIMQMVAFRTPSGGPVPPTVSGVSPSSGPAAGGSGVTITGTNFAPGATVTIGSTAAANVVVVNSTTITATTPAGSAGAVKVTVTVNGQSGSLTNGFTYVIPPTVSSVSPSSGSTAGGTGVTITGTNFVAGATVTFGSAAATNVVVANSTTITATTPAGTAGAVTVTVTVSGQSGSLANGFTYVVAPTVSSVSPNSGPGAGGTAVTITGTNFASGATVKFGSAAATNVAVTNSTTITATTPAGTAGSVTVTVTVNGQSGSLTNGFTYVVAPTVSSVSPNTGPTSGGTAVTIAGTNFAAGATVTFGSAAATNVVVANSTTITATTPAGTAGAVTVTVTVSGQNGSLPNGFTYVVAPTVSSVSPNSGPGAGGTAVTITGTNFAAGATVTFGSTAATNVVVTNSTTITATTPAGSAGAVTVTVKVNGVGGSLANAFTYIVPPTVSSVTPNTGSTSGGTAVTIAGTNFAAGATVTFGSAAATNVVVANSTTITATTPAGTVGAVTVTVTNTGSQSGSLANGFTYATVPVPTAPTNFTAAGGGSGPIVQAVQGYDNPTSLTSHTTAAFDSTGGDVIVICASSHAGVTLTPSDSFGNTWIPIAGPTSTSVGFDLRTEVWYARNPIVGPGHTITMTLSAAQPLVISIIVGKGSNISSPIDAISLIGSDNGTQTVNVASPNIATSSANDLLIGFAKVSAGATFTSGTGFTQQPAASSSFLDAETGPAATAGTHDATFTLNTSQTWQSAIAAVASNPNQASLSWNASTESGGTISQYLLERCQGAGCNSFVQIGTTAATTFNDTGLTASSSYSYRVRAQDTSGTTGPYSSTAGLTTPAPVPSLPGNLTATATSATQINLSWMASAEIGGTISNYLIERCPGANCTNFAQIGTTAATTFNDTGLTGSTSYSYRIRASDSAGHLSPYSNLAIATTPSSTPTVSYVQGNYATPQSSQTAVTVTFAQQQTVGDLNVVAVGWNDTSATVSSIVDTSGNTYALAVGPTTISGTLSQSIYYAKNIAAAAAGANTVTVTFTKAAIYADVRALEYKGADPSTPVDVTAALTGNSASSSSGAVTTTNAHDLLFGANIVTSITSGPGTGFTSRLLTSPDGDIAEDEVVSSTGSYSATAPISSGAWIMQLVAFKAAP